MENEETDEDVDLDEGEELKKKLSQLHKDEKTPN